MLPVVHQDSRNPLAELAQPDTYQRVFVNKLPYRHCFFVRVGKSTDDMKPAIQPNALVMIKPLNITLPLKHNLIDKQHPRLLKHLELVAIITNGKILLR